MYLAATADRGIAAERVVIDDQSRNTRENAVESARVARKRGWKSILVTSAFHMERALGCFKAESSSRVPGPLALAD